MKEENDNLQVEELADKIKNIKAINEAQAYLDNMESQYNELDRKNQSQKEEINRINGELGEVFDNIQNLEEIQKKLVEEREEKEAKLQEIKEASVKNKDFKVRMSMCDQEEKYMGEELERIGAQNKLMEQDKKELTRHRD